MSCGFQGNSDVFGLGIRIGYYSQIFAVWFSNYFYFREAKVLRAVNNLFLLALIVAGFVYIFNAPSTYAVEAFLLLQIGLFVGVVGITEGTRYSTAFREVSRERLILRILIMLFGAFLNVLFWWKGLNVLIPTPCDGTAGTTTTYAFYLCKANIYDWMRTLMKVQSIFIAIFTAPSYVSNDLAALMYDIRMEKARSAFIDAVNSKLLEHSNAILSFSSSATSQLQNIKLKTQNHTSAVNDTKFTVLLRVSEAEDYLASIYSIYKAIPTPGEATTSKPRSFYSSLITHRSGEKVQQQQRCTDKTPYLKCLLRFQCGIFINNPPHTLWTTLCLHETTVGNHSVWKFPRLINRMLELNRARGGPPAWQFFKIASDLALSQIPAHTTRNVWLSHALWQFLFIAFLLVQVELTIVWNNVSGLQSIFQLGQLIPLIIGVGGLVKVLWGKARMVWEGGEEGLERVQKPSEYEVAMARYVENKRPVDRQALPVRVATA